MRETNGYSLLDMLMTLAVVGVFVGLAWPSFVNLILDLKMTATINQFVHGVHLAKHTARATQRETTLCKSRDGSQCEPEGDWHGGWLIFANLDNDYPPKIDPDERVIEVNRAYESGVITANRGSFAFRPFEIRSTNGTLILCDRRGPEYAKAVIVSYTGRPRVQAAVALDKPFTCPA